jgi:sodium-dependent dicarboxylate transporter 2/3/5
VIAIAVELDVSPVPPVLAVGLAASCAFMLPIATGPNAIAYGTERVEQTTMIRSGFLLNLIASVVIVILLRILCPLYGWT